MKRFLAGCDDGICRKLCGCLRGLGRQHNGTFWNKLSPAAKRGHLNGYADAMQVCVSKLDTLVTAGDLFRWQGSRKILREIKSQPSILEVVREEAVNHLDTLYENQRLTELDLGSALESMALRPPTTSANASSNH